MPRSAGLALAMLALLAFAGPTAAATPQDIYKDLADNGRLDRHYSRADIDRALHSPSLQRYQQRNRLAPPAQAVPVTPVAAGDDDHGPLPFSGLDLALLASVGGPLLLVGASLGRAQRLASSDASPKQ
jgi:hypothetical protein